MGAGALGGRRLTVPPGIRPTTGRVRAVIFNVLADWIPGRKVVDLYSGSGALGVEALSHGAASACFVDRSPASVAAIRSNLARLELSAQARVLQATALEAVRAGVLRGADLVLVDPPFALDAQEAEALMRALEVLLEPGSVVAWESRSGDALPDGGGLELWRQRRYGSSTLSMYRR